MEEETSVTTQQTSQYHVVSGQGVVIGENVIGGNIDIVNFYQSRPTSAYRGIAGFPPPTSPSTVQQRASLVETVYEKLLQPDLNVLVLTGIGGGGKSVLAALLYHYAQTQQQTKASPFKAQPIWLSLDRATTFSDLVGTLFELFGKPLPDISSMSPPYQAQVLFNALNTEDKPRLVILDQFDYLLDPSTGKALSDKPGVGEWLDALNSQPFQSSCRLLFTSRICPIGTRRYPLTYLQEFRVDSLTVSEGVELLRMQGVQAEETVLQSAVEACNGHALSLTLLAVLVQKYGISLERLLTNPDLWLGDISTNLFDAIFQQLDDIQKALLRALSVYRLPIPLEAAQTLTASFTSAQMMSALEVLLNQQLIQPTGEGRYQLHAIVARYAKQHFVEGDTHAKQVAVQEAHARAGEYYIQQSKSQAPRREQRRRVSDVQSLVEAVWQYCQAARQQQAYELIQQEGLFADLERWGGSGSALLLELCMELLPSEAWHSNSEQTADIYVYLARAYDVLGQKEAALPYYEQVLELYRGMQNRIGEAYILDNLGSVYADLGRSQESLSYYLQALNAFVEVGSRPGQSRTLNNLGTVYKEAGQAREALNYYQQALTIQKEVGDRVGEASTLNNLGSIYRDLGQKQKALDYYQQALTIFQNRRNRLNEGVTLLNIGTLFLRQQQYKEALAALLLANQIFEEVTSPNLGKVQREMDLLREGIGEQQFATLRGQVEPQAQQIIVQVLGGSSAKAVKSDDSSTWQDDLTKRDIVPEETLPIHQDRPAEVDELGRKTFAEALALRLRGMQNEKNKAPSFMLHIHGSWGSGKTSLLNFLSEELKHADSSSPWVVVNFNAWMYQRLGSPWWWLMQAVFQQGARQLWRIDPWRSVALRSREFMWRFVRTGWPPYLTTLLALALVLWIVRLNSFFGLLDFGPNQVAVGSGKIVLAPLADIARSVSAIIALIITVWGLIFALSRSLFQGSTRTAKLIMESTRDPMKTITDHFKDLVEKIGHPVAIFIDDLDRCQGNYIVELLEGIQTLFIEAAVTYVIAADQRWVSASYDKAYETFSDTLEELGRPLGFLFLEKAFQLSTSVPPMSQAVQAEYWQHLIQTNKEEYREKLTQAKADAEQRLQGKHTEKEILDEVIRISNRGDIIDELAIRQVAVKRLASPEIEVHTEQGLKAFAPLLEPNPRAMKRLLNAYGIQRSIATLTGVDIESRQLALWTIIVLRWPLLSEYLEDHPEMVKYIATYLPVREQLPDGIPPNMRKLFQDERVCNVVRGKQIGTSLDEEVIRACAYLHTTDSSIKWRAS